MDAFISHSSEDTELAEKIQKILVDAGLTLWLDRSALRFGVLLRDELLAALRASRVMVLLWSKASSKSRWVASEFLSAYHMDHFIIPVRLDKTRLPQFLQNTVYLDIDRSGEQVLENLPRAVREAPDAANRFSPVMASQPLEQKLTSLNIAAIQKKETALIPGKLGEARKVHAKADVMVREAEKQWKYNSMILALSGYHLKNAYLLKHKVNEFFAAVEAQDFPKAFGIWNNDADWQQHTQRYAAAGYPYGRFVIDWGKESDYGIITSHKILHSTSRYGSETLLGVEINGRKAALLTLAVEKDKSSMMRRSPR